MILVMMMSGMQLCFAEGREQVSTRNVVPTATEGETTGLAHFWQNALKFMNMSGDDKEASAGRDVGKNIVGSIFDVVLPILFTILNTALVIITLVLGAQFVMASPSGKADIKQKLTPYVIALGLSLVLSTVYGIAIDVVAKLFT